MGVTSSVGNVKPIKKIHISVKCPQTFTEILMWEISQEFDIEVVQKEMLNGAKKHTGHLPLTGELPKDYRPEYGKIFLM